MRLVGGPARLRIIVVLALIPAVNGADQSTVGTVAPLLESAFHISYAQIGLILTSSGVTAALAVIPIGWLTDRSCRARLLWLTMGLCAVAMIATGAAPSYSWLLLSRIGLGAASATVGPTVASLIGDYFPSADRARVYGYILAGDLVGAGFGLLVAGNLAALFSWRWAFWSLALPSALLAWLVWKSLPEPARGGSSRLRVGAAEIKPAGLPKEHRMTEDDAGDAGRRDDALVRALEHRHARPRAELVLRQDPVSMPLWKAARYVLRIPTNRLLITSSALGYFFFAGVRAFAVLLFTDHFRLSQSTATITLAGVGSGGVLGVLAAGRIADILLRRGYPDARLIVPGTGYVLAALLFVPAFLAPGLLLAGPLFFLAAAALASANPPSDAARLDIMHFRLWGRAESIRTFVRTLGESFAPFLFGVVADLLAGRGHGSAAGLQAAFLVMLLPLLLAGLLLLVWGRRTYATDAETAIASEALPA